jgi:hypothetical protein
MMRMMGRWREGGGREISGGDTVHQYYFPSYFHEYTHPEIYLRCRPVGGRKGWRGERERLGGGGFGENENL